VIDKAQGPLGADHVQIANMGELPEATLDAFLAALTEVVAQLKAGAGNNEADGAGSRTRLRSV
jgi:aspartate aminotransferase-like enzyme